MSEEGTFFKDLGFWCTVLKMTYSVHQDLTVGHLQKDQAIPSVGPL